MQATQNKMGTARMFPLIVSMALPAMFSMLVQALYNVVDSYFVSQISEDALTAVSLAYPVQMLLIAFAVGTSVGINSLISRRLGEGNQEEADSAATHGVFLGVCTWVLFLVFGLFFAGGFIGLYAQPGSAIYAGGTSYLTICCVCSMAVFIECNFEKTLQATGNMIWPMIFQLTGAVTNIVLDPVFIFGFGPIPAMGVSGAAIATVVGQHMALLVAGLVIALKDHAVHIHLRGFRPHGRTIANIYAVGAPSIIMQAIGSVMNIAINAILVGFSSTAVAVFGVYFKLQSFVFMPVFGLTHGVMPVMGYNFGARNRCRVLAALRIGTLIAACIMAVGTALFWLIPDRFLAIFNASQEMMDIGIPALETISLCFLPAALGILFSTLFQAVGRGTYSLMTSLLRQLVVLVPTAYLLSSISVQAVWYAFPIAEVVSFIASIGLFVYCYRKMLLPLDKPLAVPAE